MKILVLGLDCATPEILLQDERLVNLRRLMEAGCYGRLESVVPPITVPAWMCLSTSQDPGSLGVYGFRNRTDHSYAGLGIVNSRSIQELAVWDQVAREGGKSVIIGVPPSFPPRKVNGICVGCFLTPNPVADLYTHPAGVKDEIAALVGEYEVDVKGFRTNRKDWLKGEIFRMSEKFWTVVRHYLATAEWDYFHCVDIGLDRVQHGFWKYHDPAHVLHEPGSPYANVIRDYYAHLDEEIGRVLELLSDDTVVLVVSDHGAQRLDGGFCVNEWLVREGLLVLNEYPKEVTPFDQLDVNWEKTKVWSEGGYYARIFFNVKGREPHGVIDPADYEGFRDEIKARIEALPDDRGRPMGSLVYKPEEVYRAVRNVAPDLIVHFGALYWRSIGGVGYPGLHVQENDTGPDDCNHAQWGAFILAASNSSLTGEVAGARLLDIAPTLLELGGYDVPSSMQGRSMVQGGVVAPALSAEGEAIVRERLSGLGYIA
ncbi:MAG TPA: alkaline phosphatase family protein [Gemmatimonadales bacterium]|nr:alkaline phosphatase family protein [Gemmatimonadales bacterium]